MGRLTLQAQVPRTLDEPAESGHGGTGDTSPPSRERARSPSRGISQGSSCLDCEGPDRVRVTVRMVVTYAGADDIRDAILNVTPPVGVTAEPMHAAVPLIRGTGNSPAGTRLGSGSSIVPVVFGAERGSGRLPSTLVAHASVVYSHPRPSPWNHGGGSEPMSARCDIQLPFALAAGVVSARAVESGTHAFAFGTNEAPVQLSTLFECMRPLTRGESSGRPDNPLAGGCPGGVSEESGVPLGGGGSASDGDGVDRSDREASTFRYWAVGAEAGEAEDVSVAVSGTPGRYRVQSESFAALCLVSTELVRRLREHLGETQGSRHRAARGAASKLGRGAGESPR